MATPFLFLARVGEVLTPVPLVFLSSPSGYFFPSPAVTGPLGQGILQRGPKPALWGLRPCDQNHHHLMRGRGGNWTTGKRPVRH